MLIVIFRLSDAAGEGLFAKKHLPKGSLIAYYAGSPLRDLEKIIFLNMTNNEREDRHKVRPIVIIFFINILNFRHGFHTA